MASAEVDAILDDRLFEEAEGIIVRKWFIRWKATDETGNPDHSWEPFESLNGLAIFDQYREDKRNGIQRHKSPIQITKLPRKEYAKLIVSSDDHNYPFDGRWGWYKNEIDDIEIDVPSDDDDDEDYHLSSDGEDDYDHDHDNESVVSGASMQSANSSDSTKSNQCTKSTKSKTSKHVKSTKSRKPHRGWTDDEEKRFVEALELYGRDWKSLSEHVATKRPVLCRSKAQTHFLKLLRDGKPLPDKVKESGIGYTLSGKPLNRHSSFALRLFRNPRDIPDVEGVISDEEAANKLKFKKGKSSKKKGKRNSKRRKEITKKKEKERRHRRRRRKRKRSKCGSSSSSTSSSEQDLDSSHSTESAVRVVSADSAHGLKTDGEEQYVQSMQSTTAPPRKKRKIDGKNAKNECTQPMTKRVQIREDLNEVIAPSITMRSRPKVPNKPPPPKRSKIEVPKKPPPPTNPYEIPPLVTSRPPMAPPKPPKPSLPPPPSAVRTKRHGTFSSARDPTTKYTKPPPLPPPSEPEPVSPPKPANYLSPYSAFAQVMPSGAVSHWKRASKPPPLIPPQKIRKTVNAPKPPHLPPPQSVFARVMPSAMAPPKSRCTERSQRTVIEVDDDSTSDDEETESECYESSSLSSSSSLTVSEEEGARERTLNLDTEALTEPENESAAANRSEDDGKELIIPENTEPEIAERDAEESEDETAPRALRSIQTVKALTKPQATNPPPPSLPPPSAAPKVQPTTTKQCKSSASKPSSPSPAAEQPNISPPSPKIPVPKAAPASAEKTAKTPPALPPPKAASKPPASPGIEDEEDSDDDIAPRSLRPFQTVKSSMKMQSVKTTRSASTTSTDTKQAVSTNAKVVASPAVVNEPMESSITTKASSASSQSSKSTKSTKSIAETTSKTAVIAPKATDTISTASAVASHECPENEQMMDSLEELDASIDSLVNNKPLSIPSQSIPVDTDRASSSEPIISSAKKAIPKHPSKEIASRSLTALKSKKMSMRIPKGTLSAKKVISKLSNVPRRKAVIRTTPKLMPRPSPKSPPKSTVNSPLKTPLKLPPPAVTATSSKAPSKSLEKSQILSPKQSAPKSKSQPKAPISPAPKTPTNSLLKSQSKSVSTSSVESPPKSTSKLLPNPQSESQSTSSRPPPKAVTKSTMTSSPKEPIKSVSTSSPKAQSKSLSKSKSESSLKKTPLKLPPISQSKSLSNLPSKSASKSPPKPVAKSPSKSPSKLRLPSVRIPRITNPRRELIKLQTLRNKPRKKSKKKPLSQPTGPIDLISEDEDQNEDHLWSPSPIPPDTPSSPTSPIGRVSKVKSIGNDDRKMNDESKECQPVIVPISNPLTKSEINGVHGHQQRVNSDSETKAFVERMINTALTEERHQPNGHIPLQYNGDGFRGNMNQHHNHHNPHLHPVPPPSGFIPDEQKWDEKQQTVLYEQHPNPGHPQWIPHHRTRPHPQMRYRDHHHHQGHYGDGRFRRDFNIDHRRGGGPQRGCRPRWGRNHNESRRYFNAPNGSKRQRINEFGHYRGQRHHHRGHPRGHIREHRHHHRRDRLDQKQNRRKMAMREVLNNCVRIKSIPPQITKDELVTELETHYGTVVVHCDEFIDDPNVPPFRRCERVQFDNPKDKMRILELCYNARLKCKGQMLSAIDWKDSV